MELVYTWKKKERKKPKQTLIRILKECALLIFMVYGGVVAPFSPFFWLLHIVSLINKVAALKGLI